MPWSILALALRRGFRASPHLLGRNVFPMGCEGPVVSERVPELAIAVAIELICQRSEHFRAGLDRLSKKCVNVLDVDVDGDR
jgi:hypothetical protein